MDRQPPGWSSRIMSRWIETLSDETARTAFGRRLEAVAGESFSVLRWSLVVGFTRYLAVNAQALPYDLLHWTTSAMLFVYLASRFLLRPEVPIFATRDRTWKRVLQTTLNLAICMAAFALVIWALNLLVDGIARYRFLPFMM